jgi:PAS domain S-box-containing protein
MAQTGDPAQDRSRSGGLPRAVVEPDRNNDVGLFGEVTRGTNMSQMHVGAVDLPPELWPALMRSRPLDQLSRPDLLLDALPAALYVTDAQGRITYFNEAAATLWGCRPKLNCDQWCGSWRLFWPDGTPLPHDECPMAMALKEGRPNRGHEAIAERPDGTRVPFMAFPTPFHDDNGVLVGGVNVLVDMSERKRADRVSRRLASIVESSDDAIVSKDLNGIVASWNKAAERLFGYLAEEVIGKSIMIIIPLERRDEEYGILNRIRRGERVEHFETKRQRKDGSLVDISLTVSPVTGEDGKIIGASKIARDITEQKRREEQITLLAREADHRTNNLLAVAQATVHLTDADTTAELKAAIGGRLRALGNAHALLAQARWTGADLRELAVEELSPYCCDGNSRAHIEGPSVLLKPDQAQAMAMTLHELATNAAKYGALSAANGRVKVEWAMLRGRKLHLRWAETGGPATVPPTKKGFGTRAVTRMIGQLDGEITFDWRPDGVRCEITVAT